MVKLFLTRQWVSSSESALHIYTGVDQWINEWWVVEDRFLTVEKEDTDNQGGGASSNEQCGTRLESEITR